MQQTEIETAFAELVENITGTQPARIDRDLNLDKLGLDSLSKIDLAVAAEDRFGIAIPDEDLERFLGRRRPFGLRPSYHGVRSHRMRSHIRHGTQPRAALLSSPDMCAAEAEGTQGGSRRFRAGFGSRGNNLGSRGLPGGAEGMLHWG